MKAFNDWYDKKQIKTMNLTDNEMGYERGSEDGWRAALEWLRDNDEAYCCGDCDEDGWRECPTLTELKKELEE